jgi:AraC-like DNA-binding protein
VADPITDMAMRRPAGALRPFVESYRGYRLEGHPPATHHGVPSRHLPLMVSFDRPVVSVDNTGARTSRWAFVGGLHDKAATIVHDGNQHGMAIQLTPMGARTVLGLPGGALAGGVVDLDAVLGAHARELYDRLAAATAWEARFRIIDEVLVDAARRRLEDPPEPPSEVLRAWRRLVATGGGVEIGTLAAEVGWSRRHLSEKFRTEVGLTPKVAARVLRFERARHLLAMPTRPGLAAVAVSCGYYDQAHFTREWTELAGCTPTRWIADELPSMQDGE